MNWKIIVGALIVFGGVKEAFAIQSDNDKGITHLNPIYGQLGCLTLIAVGLYFIYRGRKKKTTI